MSASLQQAVDTLAELGSPDDLRADAADGAAPDRQPGVNLHIHLPPNFSAFASVTQAVELAAEQGVRILAASNYYDYRVYADFADAARRHGVLPLFALEIISTDPRLAGDGIRVNDPNNPGRMYICGKGITGFAPELTGRAAELVGIIRRNDAARLAEMTAKLEAHFADAGYVTGLDAEAVIGTIVARHGSPRDAVVLQERHVAQAFQEALWARVPASDRPAALSALLPAGLPAGDADDPVTVQGQLRAQLLKAGKPAFAPETFLETPQAYELICALGGIPCYPTLADGAGEACPFERTPQELIAHLRERRIHAAELIPVRNAPEVLTRYVRAFREAGLIVVAGTEHNTQTLLPLVPTCAGGAPVPEEIAEIFYEGACVVAAHQFCRAHGEPGYVDDAGRLNADYENDQQRIAAFASLGRAIAKRYFQAHPG
ncbi:MAG: hypothetical protein KGY99_04370 [Phycisphaerae bacterium]|nr:hypothetical protein [Phycisphaerae bacterium]